MRRAALVIIAATVAVSTACSSDPAPAPPPPPVVTAQPAATTAASTLSLTDQAYLSVLADDDILTGASDEIKISGAKSMCKALISGATKIQVLGEVLRATDLDGYHAGALIGASTAAYCPGFAGPLDE